jgi:hypothetical protein
MKDFEREMSAELEKIDGMENTVLIPEGAVDAATEQLKGLLTEFE